VEFNEYQQQLADRMRDEQSSSHKALNESAADIRAAAMELRSVAAESRRQSESLRQIANPTSGALLGGGSFVSRGINDLSRPFMSQGSVFASPNPGDVGVQHIGMFNTMAGAFGLNHDPRTAKQYDAGAMQRAYARQANETTASMMNSGLSAGAGALSFSNLGGAIGGFIGSPIPIVGTEIGSAIGSAVGRPLDILNPMSFAANQFDMLGMYSGVAGRNSNTYLRGAGSGGLGRFSNRERARAASGMRQVALNDLTYDADEIADISSQYVDQGLYLGVQSSEQFAQRTKELINTHKRIRKVLNLSNQEMTDYMKQTFDQVGLDPSMQAGMGQYATQLRATAHVAGLSVQDSARIGLAGAGMARGMGLMNITGAQSALGGAALAGQAATNGVGTSLLATVGGEQGLAQLITQAQGRFLQGASGSALGLGGGASTVDETMRSLGRGMGSSGDLVNFLGNRNQRVGDAMNRMGTHGVQAQQALQLYDLAKQISPNADPETLKSTMVLLAQQTYGMDEAGAQALVQSFGALPDTISRSAESARQTRSDAMRDMQTERYSISGRVRSMYRNTMNNTGIGSTLGMLVSPTAYLNSSRRGGGLGAIVDAVNEDYARTGDRAERFVQNMQDSFYGIERTTYGQEDIEEILASANRGTFEAGPARDMSASRRARSLSGARSAEFNELIREALGTGTGSRAGAGIRRRARAAIGALRANSTDFAGGDATGITDQDIIDTAADLGIGTADERRTFAKNVNLTVKEVKKRAYSDDLIRKRVEQAGISLSGSLAEDSAGITRAMQDKDIMTLRNLIQRFASSQDPSKAEQSQEHQSIGRQIYNLKKKIDESSKPSSTKDFADQMLESSLVSIDSEGGTAIISDELRRGVALEDNERAFDLAADMADHNLKAQGAVDMHRGGISQMNTIFGTDITSSVNQQNGTFQERSSDALNAVKRLAEGKSKKELAEIMNDQSAPVAARNLARLAGQYKTGSFEGSETDMARVALQNMNRLGADTLGAETTTSADGQISSDVGQLQLVNKAQIGALNEMVRVLKEIR